MHSTGHKRSSPYFWSRLNTNISGPKVDALGIGNGQAVELHVFDEGVFFRFLTKMPEMAVSCGQDLVLLAHGTARVLRFS